MSRPPAIPRTAACPHRQLIHDTLIYVCTALPCNRHGSRRPARPRQPLHGATFFVVVCAAVDLARPWQGIPFSFPSLVSPTTPPAAPMGPYRWNRAEQRDCAGTETGTRSSLLDRHPSRRRPHPCMSARRNLRKTCTQTRRTATAAYAVVVQVRSLPYLQTSYGIGRQETSQAPTCTYNNGLGRLTAISARPAFGVIIRHMLHMPPLPRQRGGSGTQQE